MKLLVATTNAGKMREFYALFADTNFELLSLKNFPDICEVPEDGKTFMENAEAKALGYAKQSNMLTLAEDSGLCCDALEGAPGVYSARFAGEGKSDKDNNEKVLHLLKGIPVNCRGAQYESHIAIAMPGEVVGVVQGKVRGVMVEQPSGDQGFGYDPLFFYPPFQRTFGETPPEEKNKVSHRFYAMEKVKALLLAFHQ